jgi:ribonuclease HI
MIKTEDKIIIFTDGASKGNPGLGGFGAVIVFPKGEVVELGGFDKHTTNNRMELSGAISAFEKIKNEKEEVVVYTDSKYLINGMTAWIYGWQKNNWKTKEKKDVSNKDLWEKLAVLVKDRKIKWQYVGGHVGIAGNERCDEIADALATGQRVTFYNGPLAKYTVKIMDLGHSEQKKEIKSNKGAKAYSYLSLVNNVLYKDKTWAECEKRVKGKAGVRFKKAISEAHEHEILRDWGVNE